MSKTSNRQLILVVGSNRTGTSLLTKLLTEMGYQIPGERASNDPGTYSTYEPQEFKELSRKWNKERAIRFAESLPDGKIVLKYPKASYVLEKWLDVFPDARVIYVYRPREETVNSLLDNLWPKSKFRFLVRWLYRWQWNRGFKAVSNVNVPIHFVTFAELKLTNKVQLPSTFGWNE